MWPQAWEHLETLGVGRGRKGPPGLWGMWRANAVEVLASVLFLIAQRVANPGAPLSLPRSCCLPSSLTSPKRAADCVQTLTFSPKQKLRCPKPFSEEVKTGS